MRQLNKITISNIRRFSPKVEIEVGKGATIILAPNGTGKTAIFEGIELALTGGVKRLDSPPDPMIRDLQTELLIRLDFDAGKYCEAKFQKGMTPAISGNHNELFGNKDLQDTPFLLRLTHILNQRATDWFVQSNGTDAGGQLDHLSIGRDAVQVKGLMMSAKRAATGIADIAKRDQDDAEGRLKSWTDILKKRDSVNVDLIKSLIPRNDLARTIHSFSENLETIHVPASEDLSLLKSQLNALSSGYERSLNGLKSEAISLENMNLIVQEFPRSIEALSRVSELVVTINGNKKSVENEIAVLQNELQILELNLNANDSILKSLQELKRKTDLVNKNAADTAAAKANLENLNEKSRLLNQQIQVSKANLESARKLVEIQRSLQIRSEIISNRHSELLALGMAYSRWVDLNRESEDTEKNVLPDLKIRVSNAKQKLTAVQNENEVSRLQLTTAQRNFDLLNASSDAIRAAVGIIATHFPPEKGDCPVCLANYAPEQLRAKMSEALNAMDPALEPAARSLDTAKNIVAEGNSNLMAAENEYKESETKLNKVNEEVSSRNEELKRLMANFPGLSNIAEAEKYLKDLFFAYDVDKTKLDLEKLESVAEPSTEQMALLSDEENKQQIEIMSLTEQIRVANESIRDLEDIKLSLEKSLEKTENPINLNERIVAQENIISLSKAEVERLKAALIQKQLVSREHSDKLRGEEKDRSDINSRINDYRARWAELKLGGDPSEDVLKNAKADLYRRIQAVENKRKELDPIYSELARWDAAEDYFKAEEEIGKIRAEFSEGDYTKRLENDLALCKKKIDTINLKISTLNIFSRQLDTELEKVHESIRSINPVWNKLLNRIVVDPRFAETSLNSYSYRNKQHADVNVQLHGQDTLVSQVASEAQITDLQLTFLLAMAQKYQWSPWRVLLLDDPTQHHDLVHAAAVFDLLRDYIVEFDFQIVLATHDSVQAKYFMRKLENDGIPSRLWTLHATESGVTAKSN